VSEDGEKSNYISLAILLRNRDAFDNAKLPIRSRAFCNGIFDEIGHDVGAEVAQ
jgi:hypothetical protein